jgi:hypothetical protein
VIFHGWKKCYRYALFLASKSPKHTVFYRVCTVKTSVELRPERCRGEIMLHVRSLKPDPQCLVQEENSPIKPYRWELFLAVAD